MTDTHATTPRSPWTRPGFLAALGFVLAVAVLGVAVIAGGGESRDAGAAPGPAPGSGHSAPPAGASGSCPALADADQSIPQAA
ncbi:hypothetical protein ACH4EB_37945, partial [Streptomyces sp. NPDC018045]